MKPSNFRTIYRDTARGFIIIHLYSYLFNNYITEFPQRRTKYTQTAFHEKIRCRKNRPALQEPQHNSRTGPPPSRRKKSDCSAGTAASSQKKNGPFSHQTANRTVFALYFFIFHTGTHLCRSHAPSLIFTRPRAFLHAFIHSRASALFPRVVSSIPLQIRQTFRPLF